MSELNKNTLAPGDPNNLAARLHSLGYNQRTLADKLGLHPQTVSRYVRGELAIPTIFMEVLDLMEANAKLAAENRTLLGLIGAQREA